MFIRQLKDCPEFIAGDASPRLDFIFPMVDEGSPNFNFVEIEKYWDCHLRELLNAKTDQRAYRYSLAHAIVKSGTQTKPHSLKTSEVYYILEGKGLMHVNSETAEVGPGAVIDIPPQAIQFIENIDRTDLVFLCIVDPAWCAEDEVILK